MADDRKRAAMEKLLARYQAQHDEPMDVVDTVRAAVVAPAPTASAVDYSRWDRFRDDDDDDEDGDAAMDGPARAAAGSAARAAASDLLARSLAADEAAPESSDPSHKRPASGGGVDVAAGDGGDKKHRPTGEPCARCGAAASRRCGQCRETAYCGAACQRGDWPRHRRGCVAAPVPLPPPPEDLGDGADAALAAAFSAADGALAAAGLGAVAPAWDADRLEALCDASLLPVLALAPGAGGADGVGPRTLGLLFLRCGARPTAALVDAVYAAPDGGEGVASYVVARARLGPDPFPPGHGLRAPRDDQSAALAEVLAHRATAPAAVRRWPAARDLGLGGLGDGCVEAVEALLRQVAGVQEPAPSGAVDLP